ncbi:hypothetical protein FR932_03675 [Moritella marina ATCC 15381]|uniref:TonB-dependent receptor n=1 Tax=Moritella marina ATCC 15381 TaxID=1202962 RepID=A0A5J6WID1_MORMI|nr:hypothetical protein [Moritella marina]QFI36988.1 hypothetical protein FR932_03675 [Moritella marina ATCC 15381]
MIKSNISSITPVIISALLPVTSFAEEVASEPKSITLTQEVAAISSINTIAETVTATNQTEIPEINLAPLPTTKANRAVFIRGFSSLDTQATKNSAVTINHDGVYMGRTVGLAADVADLEDVLYSRGPTTNSGRNALAGNVNYVSVKPSDEFELEQEFSAGSQNELRSKTMINIPLSDTLSGRFSISSFTRDGAITSTSEKATGNFGDIDTSAFTGALRWTPNEKLTVDYAYDYSDADYISPYIQLLASDSLNPGDANEDRQTSTDLYQEDSNDHTAQGHRLNFAWQFNERTQFESISSYRMSDGNTEAVIGTQDSIAGGTLDVSQWSQEFRLSSSAVNDRINFTLGTLYYSEDSDSTAYAENSRFVNDTYDPNNKGQLYQGQQDSWFDTATQGELENIAVYGEASFIPAILNNKFTITTGLRQEWVNVDANKQYDGECLFNPTGGVIVNPNLPSNHPLKQQAGAIITALCPGALNNGGAGNDIDDVYIESSASFQMLLPSIKLNYEIGREKNVYTSVRKGWNPGGFNALAGVENFESGFDEETMMTYDLGFQGNFANRAIQLNAVAFYNDIKNHQANTSNRVHPTMVDTYNVQKAHSYGVDLDLFAFLSKNAMVKFNYSYLQMEYDEYTHRDEVKSRINGETDINPITRDVPDMIPQAPEQTILTSFIYRFDKTDFGQPTVLLTNIYRGAFYSSNNGLDILENDSFSLINLDLTLAEIPLKTGELAVNLWAKNLFDEEYTLAKYGYGYGSEATSGPVIGVFGPERTFGIKLNYTF